MSDMDDKTRIKTGDDRLSSGAVKSDAKPDTESAAQPSGKVSGKASAKAQHADATSGSNADKTRFSPPARKRQAPSNEDTASGNADKTHLQSPVAQSSLERDDKTRIARRSANPVAPERDDKTRIGKRFTANDQRGPVRKDRTRVQPASNSAQLGTGQSSPNRPAAPAGKAEAPSDLGGSEPAETSRASGTYGTLKNRFIFEEVLGSGGMGVVYKARDMLKVEAKDSDPYVAIKVLSDEFKAHPEAFIALQRESRKTQRIAHPNIVNVHDFDRDDDMVFMTMEYMEGKPLDRLISQYRSVGLPFDAIWQILEGICAALSHAHEKNIIHSDFKPGNIIVSSEGTAKVFDFGIARAVAKAEHREESKDDRTVFDAGNLGALTPAYASLEMLEGETPDVRDDIYALGCIAYELFTGEHPYNRMHADEAKRQKAKLKRIPGISKKQWQAIEKALAFKREDRTESVAAFWQSLTQKNTHTGKIAVALVLIIGLAAGAYYEYAPQDEVGFQEDLFRTQIEKDLRTQLKKEALAELYSEAAFTPAWEQTLWADVQELRRLLGNEDEWLLEQESQFYALYLEAIEQRLAADQLNEAETLVENAGRYTKQAQALEAFDARIAEAFKERALLKEQREKDRLADIERQRRAARNAQVVAKTNAEFDIAMGNVDRQLECRGSIDMRDFQIAITKARSLDSKRYAAAEPKITRTLARCIEHIGSSFPERGEEAKRDAMRLFTRNATIAAINIVPKDPCGASLAGAGARGRGATCRDKSPGLNNPPVMVVIPGKGNLQTFAIGQFEVSVGEINEFCAATGQCKPDEASDSSVPAHGISLATAKGYLQWLSDKLDRRYRLPTRAEWQHAATADGSRVDSNRNCRLNSRGISKGTALVKTSIGQKNSWGLVNHLGNVREWVTERGGRYLALGGSFETPMNECNVRNNAPHTGDPDPITGFRVLREVDA